MPVSEARPAPAREQRIGHYELVRKIGSGGIAEIFLARQPSLDRLVAVKVLSARLTSDPDILRRFDREALTIARALSPGPCE